MPRDASEVDGSLPFVTVVMPIRNEDKSIATSLGAVLSQDYPSELMEVVVADGMSDDRTREVIDTTVEAAGFDAPQVTVVDNAACIASSGLNTAISRGRGDVIVRVDGHCEIQADHVTKCVELLCRTGADNVGGIAAANGTTFWQRAIATATSSRFGVGNARFRYATEAGWVDTVFPGAWRRETFERVGGFDEELVRNQDDEHNLRITQAGGRIWLDPSIRINYEPRHNLAALGRQYFEYGFHKVRVIRKRGRIASWRHAVPPVFVAALVIAGAGAVFARKPKLLVPVVVPYAIANLIASVRAGRTDPARIPALPLVFATLHMSYGAGFLGGLWSVRRTR